MHTGNLTRLALVFAVSACSSSSPSGASSADAGSSTGGSGLAAGGHSSAPGVGGSGATSGGSLGVGGASTIGGGGSSAPEGAGGTLTAGGSSSAGGASLVEGSIATGGKSLGGATGTGGSAATGGKSGMGGATATGGAAATGGKTGAGGASATGGAAATGGKTGAGGASATGGAAATGGKSGTGGVTASGGALPTGGAAATGGNSSGAAGGSGGVTLYGSPYTNVNMWLGPVDFAESEYHNACGLEDGSLYPTVIQNLYGEYLIGLDGENIPNVESHCDDCALLTANGKTIVARIITYGIENGVDAIDLSPAARTALGLSNSNWTGTWQFCSCPTNGTPIYYEFDSRQWNPQNFWYMRIWIRNQREPLTLVETKIGNGAWAAASQQSDGAWQTVSGVDFSAGFQVRVTGLDSQQLVDSIPAPPGLNPANPVAGHANFQ